MRRVLSVASECAPLVKTGGLADVTGALPAALRPHGWELRCLLPGYPAVLAALDEARSVMEEGDLFGGPARVLAGRAGDLDVLAVEAGHLYDRPGGPYQAPDGSDWPDNDARFAALGWMAARIAAQGVAGWLPEVVHLHDWQAGFGAVYLREIGAMAGSLFTVHNMAFTGLTPAHRRAALQLPAPGFTPGGFEYHGQISALKAGLLWSDRVSTVSPGYAHELTTPAFGAGLDGVIRQRGADVSGILNGIDTQAWDPATDPAIHPFRTAAGKAPNRQALIDTFGLVPGGGPLCAVVSRLTEQKGLDLLLQALPALTARGGRLVLLGTGEPALEAAWRAAATDGTVGVRIGFDEGLARRIFAGADAVIVPSRFEPCGLTQLYALRYGAVPVVARVGGLADTVIDANAMALQAGVATGLQFVPVDAHTLAHALVRLCDLFGDRRVWRRIQRNAMATQVGWQASAPRYAALYDLLAPAPATENSMQDGVPA